MNTLLPENSFTTKWQRLLWPLLIILCTFSSCKQKSRPRRNSQNSTTSPPAQLWQQMPQGKELSPDASDNLYRLCNALKEKQVRPSPDPKPIYQLQVSEQNCRGEKSTGNLQGKIHHHDYSLRYHTDSDNLFINTLITHLSPPLDLFCRQVLIDRDTQILDTIKTADNEKIHIKIDKAGEEGAPGGDVLHVELLFASRDDNDRERVSKKKYLKVLGQKRNNIPSGTVLIKRLREICLQSTDKNPYRQTEVEVIAVEAENSENEKTE